jgi:UDP-2-acetamido-3-amino-2,3-dideoxy-glucuronate N-acetyltransferase
MQRGEIITIHESSYVEDAEIGEGTNIWHFVHIRKGAKIGKNCNIGKSVYIDTGVEIGDNTKIQNFATIYHGAKIGKNVFIGPHACFTNDIYPRANIWNEEKVAKTIVKDGASIGANSTIIADITIGKNALIGAGSVVTKDVPDYALIYGNPARIKGFVCECNNKLIKKREKGSKIEMYCSKCDKTIEIEKKFYEEMEK